MDDDENDESNEAVDYNDKIWMTKKMMKLKMKMTLMGEYESDESDLNDKK